MSQRSAIESYAPFGRMRRPAAPMQTLPVKQYRIVDDWTHQLLATRIEFDDAIEELARLRGVHRTNEITLLAEVEVKG